MKMMKIREDLRTDLEKFTELLDEWGVEYHMINSDEEQIGVKVQTISFETKTKKVVGYSGFSCVNVGIWE
jgi:N-acetylglutamate synthase-like GNAT family acetyltransferase